ncbi:MULTISPECIES: hypothetical protein [unclassified Streptomyces]|uniref:hypothetical protein n=1 Tax=unclassified Streptomyces TaxID=2593676 RepID=UPI000B845250|nr:MULTISPECIES: hypothetical protein [unclassified Streptomyces]MYS21838.1 hypothetical protein [Streptomyces sp. SID4948]
MAAVVLTAGGLTAATVTSAAAAPSVACLSSSNLVSINGTDPNGHWPPYSSARTTANCNDIQVKVTTADFGETCFQPTSGSAYCNNPRVIPANTWTLMATDVKDHTAFWLLFTSTGIRGVAAY